MEGQNQQERPLQSIHPMAKLQAYVWEKQVSVHISCSRITSAIWECRIACGPYLVTGSGRNKEKAKYQAAEAMLQQFDEVKSFPWLEQGIYWDNKLEYEMNKYFLREPLTKIEKRIISCRYWWTSSCADLLIEELAYLLQSQGVRIREFIYPGKTDNLITWEITSNPRMVVVGNGRNMNRIRFNLLLQCIDSLRERLNAIERMDLMTIA